MNWLLAVALLMDDHLLPRRSSLVSSSLFCNSRNSFCSIGKEFLKIAYGSFSRLPFGRLAIAGSIHGEVSENRIVTKARMQIFFAMLILCFA